MKCKACGKKVHYCSSCVTDRMFDKGFCSENCYKESEEYKETRKEFEQFYLKITQDQSMNEFFMKIINKFSDYTIEMEFPKWIDEINNAKFNAIPQK